MHMVIVALLAYILYYLFISDNWAVFRVLDITRLKCETLMVWFCFTGH